MLAPAPCTLPDDSVQNACEVIDYSRLAWLLAFDPDHRQRALFELAYKLTVETVEMSIPGNVVNQAVIINQFYDDLRTNMDTFITHVAEVGQDNPVAAAYRKQYALADSAQIVKFRERIASETESAREATQSSAERSSAQSDSSNHNISFHSLGEAYGQAITIHMTGSFGGN